MPRDLRSFLNAHPGQTAWMFGKGPSLDRFAMEQAGPLRCAINDVVRYVPGCVYCFANDSVQAWADVYQPGHVLFQPRRLDHDIHAARCPVAAERIVFPDDWDEQRLYWSREQLAEHGLTVLPGTLGSAVQILHVMGVAKIVCVGIDGGGQHAARDWRTRLRRDHARDYNNIRSAFIDTARGFGIEIEFFGHAEDQQPNGMMKIKITHGCFARGVPYSEGQIVDLPPLLASELIAAGRAVRASDEPAPVLAEPPVETAAVTVNTENASALRKTRKRALT